jgi:hypothetical protein
MGLDIVVVVAAELVADRGRAHRRRVTLDFFLLWLDLLAGLVGHFLPPSETLLTFD